MCRKARAIEKAIRELENGEKKSLTHTEIANHLGVTELKLHKMFEEISRSFLVSLDDKISIHSSQSDSLLDTIEDKNAICPDSQAEKNELKEMIAAQINAMPNQERSVLMLYYYETLTFKEIGAVLKVSESRISQIHSKAILRLRSRLKHQYNFN